jgi:hypothetical protein
LPPAIPEAHLLAQYELASFRQEQCFASADQPLDRAGLTVDEPSRLKLAKAVSAALQRARLTLERYAKGEPESIITGRESRSRSQCPSSSPHLFDHLIGVH